jgi:hypothetical protein
LNLKEVNRREVPGVSPNRRGRNTPRHPKALVGNDILEQMASLIYWTTSAPNALTDALKLVGHRVWEAVVLSEVEQLVAEHSPDVIIVDPGVPLRQQIYVARRHITVLLDNETTPAQVIWSVEQLLPGDRPIQ